MTDPTTTDPTTEAIRDRTDVSDDVEGRSTKKAQDEEFANQQAELARAQNQTGDNAVPEVRPIASQQVLDSHQSETFRRLRDEDALPGQQEPMGREAYEKAASEEQAKKAAKASLTERLIPGTRVIVTQEPYDERPTYGHILRCEYTSPEEEMKANSGNPALSRFAEVEEYVVRLRGGRAEDLRVAPEDLKPVSEAEYGRSVI